jgi:hypothetical protein
MVRFGLAHNPDPDAALPLRYRRDVDAEDYKETWSEGLNVFHNPHARHPVDDHFFPHCMNHRLVNDQIVHPFRCGRSILRRFP